MMNVTPNKMDIEYANMALKNLSEFFVDVGSDIVDKMNEVEPDAFAYGSIHDIFDELSEMKIVIDTIDKYRQTCIHCAESVVPGSGRFVNRVPVVGLFDTKVEAGYDYPLGAFICPECEADFYKEHGCPQCQSLSYNHDTQHCPDCHYDHVEGL